jgi:hypothetical protein
MHSILMNSVSLQGSLLSSGGMVGSLYVMVSGMKWMLTSVVYCDVTD